MMITPQSRMQWGDVEALMVFWGDHAFSHASYARAIGATLAGKQVPVFDVADQGALADISLQMTEENPGPGAHVEAWLEKHQSLHQAELAALSINSTFELSTVDFSNPEQFATWMETHARLHVAQDARLGL